MRVPLKGSGQGTAQQKLGPHGRALRHVPGRLSIASEVEGALALQEAKHSQWHRPRCQLARNSLASSRCEDPAEQEKTHLVSRNTYLGDAQLENSRVTDKSSFCRFHKGCRSGPLCTFSPVLPEAAGDPVRGLSTQVPSWTPCCHPYYSLHVPTLPQPAFAPVGIPTTASFPLLLKTLPLEGLTSRREG